MSNKIEMTQHNADVIETIAIEDAQVMLDDELKTVTGGAYSGMLKGGLCHVEN